MINMTAYNQTIAIGDRLMCPDKISLEMCSLVCDYHNQSIPFAYGFAIAVLFIVCILLMMRILKNVMP
jgi:hypothetical protein